jgi:hypothetical protein
MKTVLFLLLAGVSITLNAQHCNEYATTYPSAVILTGTFCAVQVCPSQHDRNIIAFTGMVTSAATYFVLEYVKNNKKRARRLRYL